MAPPTDLAQIGKEGFDLIDRIYGRKSRQNPHEELDYHFKRQPQCTYYRPENPIVTEKLPISHQPHCVIFRANDDGPVVSQSFHQNYPNGNSNPNVYPRQQAIALQEFGQVHPGHGMVEENSVMDSTRLAKLYRGVTKVEVRWGN